MGGNLTTINHSLNAGEVSPRFAARQDQNKYLAGCETLRNFRPLVLGGATFREGSLFVAETKTVEGHQLKRLLPFVAARTAAYVLEFGHEYIRIYRDGEPVFSGSEAATNTLFSWLSFGHGQPWEEPLPTPGDFSASDLSSLLGIFAIAQLGEVVTPYQDTDLTDIFWVQSIDVMYLLHKDYPVHKLSRISETEFTLTQVNFDPPATIEDEPTGEDLGAGTLTPSATTGDGVDFTAQNSVWFTGGDSSDIGRLIVSGGSRARIVSITSGTIAVADIIDDFVSTSPIAAEDWRLVGSPNVRLDVTNKRTQPGQIITITGKELTGGSPSNVNTFRATDDGKYIQLFGGMVKIDKVKSAAQVTATILVELIDIDVNNPAPTPAWTMEVAAWTDELGYPSSGCFFQERLWLCKGLTMNGSVVGDFENFGKGGDADTAIARTLSDDDIDVITWIKGDDTLKVATGSGIYEIEPTTAGGALTPTSFRAKPIDSNGGAHIPPLKVNPVLIYVDISEREMRELAYNFSDDKFKSPQLFRLADHLMAGKFINEITHAANPDNIIYVLRTDGTLLGLVYEQVENVIGWYVIETEGTIKSIAVIPRPSTGKDWLWIMVERENGIFIEYFEPDFTDVGRPWHSLHTDSAVVTTHDADFLVTGLDHLEGQTVRVIGDGMLFNDAVVEGGQITIDSGMDPPISVDVVEVGLSYEGRIVPLEPALAAEIGGPLIARAYAEVGAVIRQTGPGLRMRAYRVNLDEPGDDILLGEQIMLRKPYHPMDAPVPLQRGKICVQNLGYDCFGKIEISQTLPFPAEILNVVGILHVGDRWCCDTYDDPPAFGLLGDNGSEPEPPPDNPCDCPTPGAYAEIQYDGGDNVGGVAVHVAEGSTAGNFTGIAVMYVPAAANPGGVDAVVICALENQALGDVATVRDSIEHTMTAGQRLQVQQGFASPNDYIVMVENAILLGPDNIGDDFPTMVENPCKEFVMATFTEVIPIFS